MAWRKTAAISMYFCWICLLWCATLHLNAGRRLRFETYGLNEGLSQTYVYHMMQDTKGFMWFCTQDGLNRYDGQTFKVFSRQPFSDTGLNDNQINTMFESRDSELWLVDSTGMLLQYQRQTETFKHFRPDANDPYTPSGPISNATIIEDKAGMRWLFPREGGLDRFDPATGIFTHYPNQQPNGQNWGTANALHQDDAGRLWLGTRKAGLWRYLRDEDRWERVIDRDGVTFADEVYVSGRSVGSPDHDSMFSDATGLWVSTRNKGLARYHFDTGTFTFFPPPRGRELVTELGIIYPDPSGDVWIVYTNRLLGRLNPETGTTRIYQHDPKDPKSLPPGILQDAHLNEDGSIWLAGSEGLAIYDRADDGFTRIVHNPEDPQGLPGNIITKIYRDRQHNLWFAVRNIGLAMFSERKQMFARFPRYRTDRIAETSPVVWAFGKGRAGAFWVGTDNGMIKMSPDAGEVLARYPYTGNPKNGPPGQRVRLIIDEPDGSLLVSALAPSGISRFQPDTGTWIPIGQELAMCYLRTRQGALLLGGPRGIFQIDAENTYVPIAMQQEVTTIQAMAQDKRDVLWIATGTGLVRWDRENNRQDRFEHDPDNPQSLPQSNTLTLYLDAHDDLWIGTFGGGLSRKPKDALTFEHFTMADGLPNNVIYGILPDRKGHLWLSTNKGLSQFNPQTGSFLNYGVADGLQSPEFNAGAYLALDENTLLFGGINGFNAFRPEGFAKSVIPPQLSLSAQGYRGSLGRDLADGQQVTLNPTDNAVEFQFTALDFVAPGRVRYHWTLEGFNDSWFSGDRHSVTYTNLAPGKYRFRVKAGDVAGAWRETETSVNLVVQPTMTQTIWFRAAILLLVIGLIIGIFVFQRRRMQRQKEDALKARELMRKTEELEFARQVQLAMLPRKKVALEGIDLEGHMITASEVGGDYFDFFQISPNKLCIAYGDATGHGVAAGLVVGMVKMATTVWSFQPGNLPRLMRNLNQALKQTLPIRSMGMALGMAVLDLETLNLEICSCGMPFPILYRSGQSTTRPLELRSPPLGFLDRIQVATRQESLQPGDSLAFLSDGFGERFDGDHRLWGDDAVLRTLDHLFQSGETAGQVISGLVNACNDHGGQRPNDDDMTVVVLRIPADRAEVEAQAG